MRATAEMPRTWKPHSRNSHRMVTGNLAMPGFTAPKLLWVRKHEPEIFAAALPRMLLLPKVPGFATV